MTKLTRQLLEQEARARRDLIPADYDRAFCAMLDGIAAPPHTEERIRALLALASVTLRHGDPTLVASRACCAQHLLSLRSEISRPELRRRIELLFLLAWLQLGAVVERGPASISTSPPLPYGVALPNGVDLEEIADPALREQARELAARWSEEVERFRAKQRALDEQTLLATLLRGAKSETEDDAAAMKVLAAAMSLAPGVPSALRKTLEDIAG